jgi:glycosyltransferase involved in cell wall biosynthesis
MRILFLCSSQEPGRDGVGDYVRLLAGACARLGHACAIAALRDPFVAAPTASVIPAANEKISCLRIPPDREGLPKAELFHPFRDAFRPDWLSFHLVPYAFDLRGILRRPEEFQALVGDTARLHLMFHELWLGAGSPSPFRHYLIGPFQRRGIRRLLARTRPRLVTTSNPAYAEMLRPVWPEVELLPLFGNIPVSTSVPSPAEAFPATGITEENRGEWWIGLFFGSLHDEWRPEPFFGLLLRAAERAGKRVCLVLAGRAGETGEALWRGLQADYGTRIVFLNRGEQTTGILSALLQLADFGVAASPWQLIGKSGTAAAMLDHGLPVIVTRDDFQPYLQGETAPSSDPLIHRCDERLEAKLVAGLPKRPPQPRADGIAAAWCDRLSALSA